jgi:small subunit ribosomal protein S20
LETQKKKPSVLKRARQAEKRRLRNRSVRSMIKTATKKLFEAVEANDKERVERALGEAVKVIDSARSKGVLHRNTAARNISRLARRANSVLRAEAA